MSGALRRAVGNSEFVNTANALIAIIVAAEMYATGADTDAGLS